MRLIDLVAQCRSPFVVRKTDGSRTYRLQGAADLAAQVCACPTRYLLTDELARLCAELAYSAGDKLVQCLDLVRVPAASLWVEWNESAELAGAASVLGDKALPQSAVGRRAGAYVSSGATGRQAKLCSFWSDGSEPFASPFEAALDFDEDVLEKPPEGNVFHGGWVFVTDTDPEIATLLKCACFRLEPTWAQYYRDVARSDDDRAKVVRDSLGRVARGVLVMLPFLLLLMSREGVAVRSVTWETLNRKRVKNGKKPLLDHLEVSLALMLGEPRNTESKIRPGAVGRIGPRRTTCAVIWCAVATGFSGEDLTPAVACRAETF